MGTILLLLVVLVVFFMVMGALYRQTSKLVGRIKDYCIYKNTTASCYPILLMLIGVVWILMFNNNIGMMLPGIVMIALPILWQLFKSGGDFWKVLIMKAIAFPIFLAQLIFGVLGGSHRKSKTKNNWDGSKTTYTWLMPERIVQDGWDLQLVYNMGGVEYYENYDGMRCIADHKQTIGWENVQYDIKPLYNVREPLPGWIAWLY